MGPNEKGRSNSAGPTSKWLELDPMLWPACDDPIQSSMFAWLARGPCQYIPTFHCHFFLFGKLRPIHSIFYFLWTGPLRDSDDHVRLFHPAVIPMSTSYHLLLTRPR